jgi:hypothetical protein
MVANSLFMAKTGVHVIENGTVLTILWLPQSLFHEF